MGYSAMVSSGLAFNPKNAYSRPTDLEITDIRGTYIAANYDYPIIKVYTNQDLVGLGEVRDAGWIAQALMMKPYLVGKDPLDIESILRSIRHLTGQGREVVRDGNGRFAGGYCAIDIALMDIAGKAMGWPCWKLLGMGKKFRDEIPVYADTAAVDDLEKYAGKMQRRIDRGFQHYKMDLQPWLLEDVPGALEGGLPTQKGIEVWGEYVRRVREEIGYDVRLGADHFGPMTVETGVALGEHMAESPYSLAYIEDVVHFSNFDSININRQITKRSPTPTLGFEDLFGIESFAPFIEADAVAIIHPDLLTSGGMIETKRIADYADRHGIKTMFHCACSPIGTMANVHTAATVREFISLENHALEMPWWDDLVTGVEKPIVQQGGVIPVPEGPGLGVELNEEVARKHRRTQNVEEYDPGFFEPTPEFDQPMFMEEAREKGIIGGYHTRGPWWHINADGEYAFQGRGD